MVQFDIETIKCAVVGGLLLGVATSLNYVIRGKVTGMSGSIHGIISLNRSELPEKLTLIGGMLVASAFVFKHFGYGKEGGFQPFGPSEEIANWTHRGGFALAGFLVGFGTKLSNGCTSGHGLCGLPRFSRRSWAAVCVFLVTAIGVSTLDYYFGLGPIAGSLSNSIEATSDHTLSANVTLAVGAVSIALGSILGKTGILDQFVVTIVGAMFSLGLMISGMSRRSNILHFLQINNQWNPALLFVLGSGLLVNLVTFTIMKRRGTSLNGSPVFDPQNSKVDWQLILGAMCFGMGWGIAGICPGPFVVLSSVSTVPIQLYWGISMVVGMKSASSLQSIKSKNKKA